MQASRQELSPDPPKTDVGSAKQQREHPPVYTGLNIALHGLAGSYKRPTYRKCKFFGETVFYLSFVSYT